MNRILLDDLVLPFDCCHEVVVATSLEAFTLGCGKLFDLFGKPESDRVERREKVERDFREHHLKPPRRGGKVPPRGGPRDCTVNHNGRFGFWTELSRNAQLPRDESNAQLGPKRHPKVLDGAWRVGDRNVTLELLQSLRGAAA